MHAFGGRRNPLSAEVSPLVGMCYSHPLRMRLNLAAATAVFVVSSCGGGPSITDLSEIGNGHPNDNEYISEVRDLIDYYNIPGSYPSPDLYELAVDFCDQWRTEGFTGWAGSIRSINNDKLYGFTYNSSAYAARLYCDDMLSGLQETVLEFNLQP
jgi:hypothetical protein